MPSRTMPTNDLHAAILRRIGGEAILSFQSRLAVKSSYRPPPLRDTRAAVELILRWACLRRRDQPRFRAVADIHAVGHRVVHGGEHFKQSVKITTMLCFAQSRIASSLRHFTIPPTSRRIQAQRESLRERPSTQVAVFDTAFHQTIAGARLSLRDPLPALSSISHPPVWLSCSTSAPLRMLIVIDSYNSIARDANQCDYDSPW